MTHKLAKKLKDAGFPIKGWSCSCCPEMKGRLNLSTLSELIEACGNNFAHLVNNRIYAFSKRKNWTVIGTINSNSRDFEGDTPEEAVANLWLKLNEERKI